MIFVSDKITISEKYIARLSTISLIVYTSVDLWKKLCLTCRAIYYSKGLEIFIAESYVFIFLLKQPLP